jgi:hypothetical protein
MPELTIRNFSCIQSASFAIKRLNVIIGPQGSGKSVTTKLVYFFADLFQGSLRHAEDGLSLSDYKKALQKSFSIWFPVSAWGNERFNITYLDSQLNVRVMRRVSKGNLSDDVTITLSKAFEDSYNFVLNLFLEARTASLGSVDRQLARDTLEFSWRTRDSARKHFRKSLGADIIQSQTFIPAGRAFFTSIGRLVAGIEHAGSLDPATLKFARIFASWRDQISAIRPQVADNGDYENLRIRVMTDLFGGIVQSKRDSEYIEMRDGRKVPFSSLSSGQQELLPIWYFLDNTMFWDAFFRSRSRRNDDGPDAELIYIEEPEAHLFPSSQSLLLDILVEIVLSGSKYRRLIITTHSPYIMSELNVLLKAGQLSRRKRRVAELGKIVDRSRWLNINDVAAVSIEGGVLCSIIDPDSELVDARFLDSISDVTSKRFDSLLDLEDQI